MSRPVMQHDGPPDLTAAIDDLDRVADEAREEGCLEPSAAARSNARGLLEALYDIAPQRFEVYPMPDGEVAIDACSVPGSSVIVLCGPEGGAVCLVHIGGEQHRRSYARVGGLPDAFLRSALQRLAAATSLGPPLIPSPLEGEG